MKAIIGFLTAGLSQVFAGLFLGILWNYSLAPLGLPVIPIMSAVAAWGLIVTATVMISYIVANVVMSVVDYYRRLALTETIQALVPANKDKKDDDLL